MRIYNNTHLYLTVDYCLDLKEVTSIIYALVKKYIFRHIVKHSK